MKKKGFKTIALILAVVCVFSGCGKVENDSGKNNQQQNSGVVSEKGEDILPEKEEQEKVYVQPEMKGEITISTFVEPEFLRNAAESFMKKYPDITVTIHAFDGSGEDAVANYQTYLNTKIMSQKAEDIFFNSFLPVAKYSEMGVFADLSEYVSLTPEFTDANYFMNVLTAAKQEDGSIYLIPYIAKFDCMSYSLDLLEKHEDIRNEIQKQDGEGFSECMNIAEKLLSGEKNAYLVHIKDVSYMDYLLKDNFSSYVDVKNGIVNINNDSYISLLEQVKKLSEDGYFGDNISNFYHSDYEFAATVDYDVQAGFYELDANAGQTETKPLTDENGNVSINANGCFALNAASEHKDLAWEFMRYVLSDEIQSLPSIYGLSVNKKGFEQAVTRYYDLYTDKQSSNVTEEAYRNLLYGWMEKVSVCDTVDGTIWTLIDDENGKFFNGKQTAVETANNLQKILTQYFNE